jgi:hypothetical protein
MKPSLKAPETQRLKLNCEEPLSNFNFNFNLRRYTSASHDNTMRFWRGE